MRGGRRRHRRRPGRASGLPALTVLAGALILLPAAAAWAVELADSVTEWNPGVQYADGWAYGWRNLATDPGPYDPSHFRLFLNDGSGGATPVSQNGPNQWDGTQWRLGGNPPWTRLGQVDCHPNGINNGEEHWVIRRWSHPSDVTVRIVWQLTDTAGVGSGVTGRLFLEGTELASISTDGPQEELVYYLNYRSGDRLDFAITPVGVDGDPGDGGDSTDTTIVIDTDLPPDPLNPIGPVADSVADFSGVQGQAGWHYGYYDQRLDVEQGNRVYDTGDFVAFLNDGSNLIANDPTIGAWMSHPNHWSGSLWDLFDQTAYFQGPWTFVSDQLAQPAANGQVDPSVHWAVRRWVSDFEGVAAVSGVLENTGTAGDGVYARFFADGFEYYVRFSDGNPSAFDVRVPVAAGTLLDFALDADGSLQLNRLDPASLDLISDAVDQSRFEIEIEGFVQFVPEPSGALPLLAGAVAVWGLARRREASGRGGRSRRTAGGDRSPGAASAQPGA